MAASIVVATWSSPWTLMWVARQKLVESGEKFTPIAVLVGGDWNILEPYEPWNLMIFPFSWEWACHPN
jgi:hypothetical protein